MDAWRDGLEHESIPASVLQQAFLPAATLHLAQAYGWFLLTVVKAEPLPVAPPGCVAELPAVPEGKALPGEIRELAQLETDGWLADMLAPQTVTAGAARGGNLAMTALQGASLEQARGWHDQLGAIFERMGDSLDEF